MKTRFWSFLAAFLLTQSATAGTTVHWSLTAPTQNVDGTALTNLKDFVFRWYVVGTNMQAGSKTYPATTVAGSFEIACGKYEIAVTARNTAGTNSEEMPVPRKLFDTGIPCPLQPRSVTNVSIQ